uniref:Cytochrome P450 n=1 Tax=Anopheles coluzzii TaxID=1518534 RepID=A0A6E8WA99_ANOCL
MLLILFGTVVAFVALVYIFLTWEFGFWEKYGVKGPKPKILLGNIPYLLTKKRHTVYNYDQLYVMAKYTTDVVASCIFAIDAQSFVKENPEIRLMGKRIMNFNFVVQLALLVTTFFPSDAIRYRKENKINRTDFLDHLLQLQDRKQITDIDIAGHGVSFFADGFETSSIVLTYCLYDLAKYPTIQQELRDEIAKAKQAGGGTMLYEQLGEMALLEQIICESMRIHPLMAVMAKRCTADTTLVGPKDRKIFVKKGTTVVLPYYSICFDAEHFADPYKYDPKRFAAENGGSKAYRERGVYFPFGDGPRMCLGMRFAVTQVRRAIVEVVERFSISVSSKTIEPFEMDPDQFMLMPKGSIWLDFKPIA